MRIADHEVTTHDQLYHNKGGMSDVRWKSKRKKLTELNMEDMQAV